MAVYLSAQCTAADAGVWQLSTAQHGLAKNTCFQNKYNARYMELMNAYVISQTEQQDLFTVFGAPYEELRKLGMSNTLVGYMQTVVTECDRQVENMLQAEPPPLV